MNAAVKRIPLSIDVFSPKILWSALFTQGMEFPKGLALDERYVYDYEIEYFTESNGGMFIDGKYYTMQPGDIVFRKPGQITQAIMQYCCYVICFDLTGDSGKTPEAYDFNSERWFQNYYENPILEAIPPVFHTQSSEKYHQMFDSVLKEYINPSEASEILLKSTMLKILYELYTDSTSFLTNHSITLSSHYTIIKNVVDYIKKNLNRQLDLRILSDIAGLSPNHFHKVFTEAMDITPNKFINKVRLEKAKEILVITNKSIYEIALQCGFENTPYFSYLFKKQYGITPKEFRIKHCYSY